MPLKVEGTTAEVFAPRRPGGQGHQGAARPFAGPAQGRRGSADQRSGDRIARRPARLPGGRGQASERCEPGRGAPAREGHRGRPEVRHGPGQAGRGPHEPRQDPGGHGRGRPGPGPGREGGAARGRALPDPRHRGPGQGGQRDRGQELRRAGQALSRRSRRADEPGPRLRRARQAARGPRRLPAGGADVAPVRGRAPEPGTGPGEVGTPRRSDPVDAGRARHEAVRRRARGPGDDPLRHRCGLPRDGQARPGARAPEPVAGDPPEGRGQAGPGCRPCRTWPSSTKTRATPRRRSTRSARRSPSTARWATRPASR